MQLPGIVFYGVYKVIFCIVVPYGIMATLPVKIWWRNGDRRMYIWNYDCCLFFFLSVHCVEKKGYDIITVLVHKQKNLYEQSSFKGKFNNKLRNLGCYSRFLLLLTIIC